MMEHPSKIGDWKTRSNTVVSRGRWLADIRDIAISSRQRAPKPVAMVLIVRATIRISSHGEKCLM